MNEAKAKVLAGFEGAVRLTDTGVEISDPTALQGDAMDRLVWAAVFGADAEREAARAVIWDIAQAVGCRPASIHVLYIARGRGDVGGFTVPAINVRMMAYDTARAVFRAAVARNAAAILLEISRSEIAYTDQRPVEYVSVILGAIFGWVVFAAQRKFELKPRRFLDRPIESG